MIILIVGDFGVGKDTFADMLLECFSDNAQKVQSYTTREPRFPGEDTHIFINKETWQEYQNMNPSPIVAETIIDNHFYGTINNQFDADYNIYVVDDIGVRDVLNADIDSVFIIEIIRPKWLINASQSRLNRKRTDKYDYSYDFRVINDGSLDKLRSYANEVFLWITKNIE